MEQLLNLAALSAVEEVELIYKSKVRPSDRPLIISSKNCYDLLLQTWDENKIDFVEQFKVLLLNRCKRVLCIDELSTGGFISAIAVLQLILLQR